jgi:hypothetical protein
VHHRRDVRLVLVVVGLVLAHRLQIIPQFTLQLADVQRLLGLPIDLV